MSRQTELIARRIAEGLCRDCGRRKPQASKRRCKACAAAEADRQRRRRGTITPGRRGRMKSG